MECATINTNVQKKCSYATKDRFITFPFYTNIQKHFKPLKYNFCLCGKQHNTDFFMRDQKVIKIYVVRNCIISVIRKAININATSQ